MYDVVIIGSGPAGLYASRIASLRGLSFLLLESGSKLGGQLKLYSNKSIFDLPGFPSITAGDFLNNLIATYDLYDSKREHLKLNTIVTKLEDFHTHYKLQLNSGETIETKYIVIAKGYGKNSAIKLDIEGSSSSNVIYSLPKTIKEGKTYLILGGGNSALDYAYELSNLASKVILVHRREEFRGNKETLSSLEGKVDILRSRIVSKLIFNDNIVTSIELTSLLDNSCQIIDLDYLLVAYGFSKDSDPIFDPLLEIVDNGYLVNSKGQTSIANILAIGDCCHYLGKINNLLSSFEEGLKAINYIHSQLHPYENTNFYALNNHNLKK